MRDEYDFSDAVKNPYTDAAKAAHDRATDGKDQKQKNPAGKKRQKTRPANAEQKFPAVFPWRKRREEKTAKRRISLLKPYS